MAFSNLTKTNIHQAIKYIEKNGVPREHKSSKYDLIYEGKKYPPKLLRLGHVVWRQVHLDF